MDIAEPSWTSSKLGGNNLLLFVWNRLPLDKVNTPASPSLAEDWFAEDSIASGSPFIWRSLSAEESHRRLFRYAVWWNVETGLQNRYPAEVLLNQMVLLLPAVISAALMVSAGLSRPTLKETIHDH